MSPPFTTAVDRRARAAAFSLIEVLSAMAILSIIILMVARLFADSTQSWKLGTRRVEQDFNARASLELIGRQLTMAMVDTVLTMRVKSGPNCLYGTPSDIVTFASFDQRAEIRNRQPYRDVQQTRYALYAPPTNPPIGYLLLRYVTQNESLSVYRCYEKRNWTSVFDAYPPEYANVLAEHVARFNVYVYVPDASGNPVRKNNYDSQTDPPPLWIDVVLFLLDEDDAIRAANLSGTARENYLNRNVRRYVHRAFPHNWPGMNVP